ncbi:peptidoglycan/LPS O-acetylase OafA/YrhL [Winogradskyella wandonensis]|uniref:Peptidoglycan/LPS O-acetylase OafA/YrhL n=1 Tax=Winogradskyella wandonensis TaxID=1442586 RepID=A0A4R1KR65_9FLAO|nr:acyltransferase [Winogradskyella wandonensis]TCK66629.1 peptidoglycan/LPS O-acetylase OafA/YrhL [Winogradskyella wandonensis]
MWNIPNRNFGLDVIRATAITLVVISHCTYILPEFNSTLTNAIRLLGATGVDIFFVLSGYLIGGILLRKLETNKTNFKDLFHFWKRRWFRTLPNYFAVLFLNITLVLFLGDNLVDDVWLYIPFLQNFYHPHPDFFTEAWSLSIEEYAYLILPLAMYLGLSFFKKIKSSIIFIQTTILIILVLFVFKLKFYLEITITDYSHWSATFRKVVIYRLDAIYYGFIMVFLMSKYTFFRGNSRLFLWSGFLLFIVLHLLILVFDISPDNFLGFFSLFYLPLVSISIALVFPFFISLKKNRLIGLITYVSKRSYSIYLVNYSLILLSLKRFFQPSFFIVIVFLILTLIISEILYRTIEIPFLRLRKRLVPR